VSNIPSIGKAKESAKTIFEVIDEKSDLDVRKSNEKQITTIKKCEIEFTNVYFKYPSRDHIVLNNFNMRIPANAKVALVGHSGCGKSTVTNLMLRFYDIMSGNITIDGIGI
jgi:ABC-type multidrug transport system fused ATPase/permease subunit